MEPAICGLINLPCLVIKMKKEIPCSSGLLLSRYDDWEVLRRWKGRRHERKNGSQKFPNNEISDYWLLIEQDLFEIKVRLVSFINHQLLHSSVFLSVTCPGNILMATYLCSAIFWKAALREQTSPQFISFWFCPLRGLPMFDTSRRWKWMFLTSVKGEKCS